MADVNGKALEAGDIIEIVHMDDPMYVFLVGVRGVVHEVPGEDHGESHETQVFVVLDHPQIPAISTQQAWVAKVE